MMKEIHYACPRCQYRFTSEYLAGQNTVNCPCCQQSVTSQDIVDDEAELPIQQPLQPAVTMTGGLMPEPVVAATAVEEVPTQAESQPQQQAPLMERGRLARTKTQAESQPQQQPPLVQEPHKNDNVVLEPYQQAPVVQEPYQQPYYPYQQEESHLLRNIVMGVAVIVTIVALAIAGFLFLAAFGAF